MVKNTTLFLFILAISFSCQSKSELSESKMKEVILKIHECEAYQELKFANQNSSFLENCKMQVFHDAQITKEQFEKSMAYYRKNPKKLEDIYDSLLLKYN